MRAEVRGVEEGLIELRGQVEQNMERTRSILASQADINKQMGMALRVGWWHSFEQSQGQAVLNKELANLAP